MPWCFDIAANYLNIWS